MKEISIPIHGMSCGGCAARVAQALNDLPGVTQLRINLAADTASVVYDPNQADFLDLYQAIIGAGVEVPTTQSEFTVTGMTCISCATRVQGALGDLPGVLDAVVQLTKGTAQVTCVSGMVTAGQMAMAVEDAGYQAVDIQVSTPSVPMPVSSPHLPVRHDSKGSSWSFKKLLGRS